MKSAHHLQLGLALKCLLFTPGGASQQRIIDQSYSEEQTDGRNSQAPRRHPTHSHTSGYNFIHTLLFRSAAQQINFLFPRIPHQRKSGVTTRTIFVKTGDSLNALAFDGRSEQGVIIRCGVGPGQGLIRISPWPRV